MSFQSGALQINEVLLLCGNKMPTRCNIITTMHGQNHFKFRFYCISVFHTCKFVLENKVRSTQSLCLLTIVIINSAFLVCFCVCVEYVHEVFVIYSYLKTTKCIIFLPRPFDLQSFAIAPFGPKVRVYY